MQTSAALRPFHSRYRFVPRVGDTSLPLLGEGSLIILTSSVGVLKGIPTQRVYMPSKALIRTLARTWILEPKDRKIRVNVVTPDGFDTPEAAALVLNEEARQQRSMFAAMVPSGRIGEPVELTNKVAFLASDARWKNRASAQPDRRAHARVLSGPRRTQVAEFQGDRSAGGCNGDEGRSRASALGQRTGVRGS